MNKITNLQQITTTLQEQIQSILTEPFHDETETQEVWDELQCELWFLTSISGLTDDDGDGSELELLVRALTYTEFEDELEQDMVLTLSIVEDSCKGIYLLMPKTLLTELRQHFSISSECSALIKQDTSIMEYNPIIEVLNDKKNEQNLHG